MAGQNGIYEYQKIKKRFDYKCGKHSSCMFPCCFTISCICLGLCARLIQQLGYLRFKHSRLHGCHVRTIDCVNKISAGRYMPGISTVDLVNTPPYSVPHDSRLMYFPTDNNRNPEGKFRV